MLDWISSNLKLLTGIVGGVTGLLAALIKWRVAFLAWLNRPSARQLLEEVVVKVDGVVVDMEEVKKEIRFNGGGSIKDHVTRMDRMEDVRFWLKPQPGFLCEQNGSNNKVTEAYCQLVSTGQNELEHISWKSFIHNDDLAEYGVRWESALKNKQGVIAVARFIDRDQKPRGAWKIKITPIAPLIFEKGDNYLFMGLFYPVDDQAREIWEEHGWSR